ncbi:hypothetical protein COW36_24285 [bacterium (Candidatus Blackallbacteria) CG17_big_fil_post_rev_8_21_14_2_50_48_46]|uniref:PrcB C-terminal domain-containing protein n=1 Tax=bacterium (Candidatus Blackallbacteria) CG17_big_fil_post_rev_8_21_14_2_50_48_46 TaxID=2014261 RepID=A0A2M7FXF1_9BACT|nr:MAG: hypothetical protein COW64_19225 [bacterium (Candidatus Blackallbacteria) CG18_big_fil_WC_8_21_14_2_50_49_26]PIW13789.1 MAG: hypothetical protein COW36_24285 [bacterium (Candidatus Blackallbacteria) CG17_big_fil_post_rev_8_21_14_2_50_48_46]PIW45015.1 MAG: hypothetical protein COW20_21915 [bacterium (Candidatus Blackallbacteria) CG13_big_fil_rev_8_21_14_2_50_49_14]
MKSKLLLLTLLLGLNLPVVAQTQGFTPLQQAVHSQILTFRTAVVETPEAWQELWKEHQGSLEQLPRVDFKQDRVVAVFLGKRATAGYQVQIAEILQQGEALEVRYRETKPARNQLVPMVLTAPACFVILPRGQNLPVHFVNADAPAPSLQKKDLISMRTLSRVSNSRVTEPRFVIARDQETFRQLWKEHNGSLEQLPEVDFHSEMVVAIFMGERSTGGYAVTIEQVEQVGEELKISYSESEPPEGSMTIQILTAPAHLIAIPQSEAYPEFIKK